jgi:hypothetical protein
MARDFWTETAIMTTGIWMTGATVTGVTVIGAIGQLGPARMALRRVLFALC